MLLVTGIAGNSGKYFLQELIQHQYSGSMRCIVMPGTATEMLEASGLDIEIVEGDLQNYEFVKAAMKGADEVVHIASKSLTLQVALAARVCQ